MTPLDPPVEPFTPLWPPQVRETLESDEAVQDGHAVPLAANLTWARFQVACPPKSPTSPADTHPPAQPSSTVTLLNSCTRPTQLYSSS